MIKKCVLKWISYRIEWQWIFIKRGRKKINRMIESGYELFSEEIIKADRPLNRRCEVAYILESKYKEIAGI